jgi:excisionase family DNA binding protein
MTRPARANASGIADPLPVRPAMAELPSNAADPQRLPVFVREVAATGHIPGQAWRETLRDRPPVSPPTPQHFLTIKTVAARLGVSVKTVRRAIERKDLVAYEIGRLIRVTEEDYENYIATRRRF